MDRQLIEALVAMGDLDPKYLDARAARGKHRFQFMPQGGDGYGYCADCGTRAQCLRCGRPGTAVGRLWCECPRPAYRDGPCPTNKRL